MGKILGRHSRRAVLATLGLAGAISLLGCGDYAVVTRPAPSPYTAPPGPPACSPADTVRPSATVVTLAGTAHVPTFRARLGDTLTVVASTDSGPVTVPHTRPSVVCLVRGSRHRTADSVSYRYVVIRTGRATVTCSADLGPMPGNRGDFLEQAQLVVRPAARAAAP